MDSQELRIGNCITLNGNYITVTIEDLNRIYYKTIHGYSKVLLTPEIILKCGFKQELIKHQYSLGLITLQLANENDYHKKGRIYYNSWAIKNECIKYLHQLQNLYFELTGKELEINLLHI